METTNDTDPRIKVSIKLTDGSTSLRAMATVSVNGMRVPGFKVVKSKYNRGLIMFLPSKKGDYGYFNTIGFNDVKLQRTIETLILNKYRLKQSNIRKKQASPSSTPIRAIPLKLLFHIYRHHKEFMTQFRLWFAARFVLDQAGSGWVNLRKLATTANMSPRHIKSVCKSSNLFQFVDASSVYYTSFRKIIDLHKLYLAKGILRGEKITSSYQYNIKNNKRFASYITRCYAENDRNKVYPSITNGRIGYDQMAKRFNTTMQTAISNIRVSKVKKYDNTKYFAHITFNSQTEFHQWLLQNMDRELDGKLVGGNPRSYFIKRWANKRRKKYVLVQRKPNIYRFTGAFQRNARTPQGQRKRFRPLINAMSGRST